MTLGDRAAVVDLRGFGQRLRRARESAGVTQEGLGALSGVSRGEIGRIEAGTINVPLGRVFMLAEALGLKAWQLLVWDDVCAAGGEELP